jgi:N-methylhydantoinase B
LTIATRFKDPITFEVFKNGLTGLADEMGLVLLRTGHSPILSQAMDFSTAFGDPDGRVLAQGISMMIHVGTFPDVLSAVLRKFDGRIYPGDVYIFNCMDEVTQHLNDTYLVRPCFLEEKLIGFALTCAHQMDVGGSVPGSMDISASEIFQEGLQIPLVKLYERGELKESVVDIALRNVRLPALYWGDVEGHVAALRTGEIGLAAMVERYSLEGFRALSNELLDYTERVTRAAIEKIPDGTYEFEDWLDDDGISVTHDPIPLRVKIVIAGDSAVVDWEGTAPQVASSINVHITNTRSVSYGVLMGAIQEEILSNEGFYRCISVRAPDGSLVNAKRPAAVGYRGAGCCYRMVDALLGALHHAVPDRIPAAGDGGPAVLSLSGFDATGARFLETGVAALSGWGARPGLDGIDYVSPFGANIGLRPVEMTEQEGRLRVESLGYESDTGGAGQWRGCVAVRSQSRLLVDAAVLRVRAQRHKTRPYGLAGGEPGTLSHLVVNPNQPNEQVFPGTATIKLTKGDIIRYVHSAGGGYGHRFLRDPEAVLDDVLDEKITVDFAERTYGVAVDVARGRVDKDKTAALRHAAIAGEAVALSVSGSTITAPDTSRSRVAFTRRRVSKPDL